MNISLPRRMLYENASNIGLSNDVAFSVVYNLNLLSLTLVLWRLHVRFRKLLRHCHEVEAEALTSLSPNVSSNPATPSLIMLRISLYCCRESFIKLRRTKGLDSLESGLAYPTAILRARGGHRSQSEASWPQKACWRCGALRSHVQHGKLG